MILLAVETATSAQSVALLRDEVLLAEQIGGGRTTPAEGLLPAIDALLSEAGLPLDAVQALAVSIGPGSFTGLRVGLATVKGLAFGGGPRVAPVPTLAALAAAAPAQAGPVAALLDARRGEVYAGLFPRPGEDLESALEERVFGIEDLAERLPRDCAVLAGEGTAPFVARLAERVGSRLRLLPAEWGVARAARVGRLGARWLAAGGSVAAEALVPRYVRRAEAEVRRTGERFEARPRKV